MISLLHLLATYGYWAVLVFIAIESPGIPFPGETMLLGAAIFAGTTHRLFIPLVILAAACGAILGDNLGFLVGCKCGYHLLRRYGRALHLDERKLKLGQYLFMKHGGKVVFFGRFVAVLRAWAAFLAGTNRMRWPNFLLFNALGGIVWAILIGTGGYYLGDAMHRLNGPIAIITLVLAALVTISFLVFVRHNEQRLEVEAERTLPGPLYTYPTSDHREQASRLQGLSQEKASPTPPAQHTQEASREKRAVAKKRRRQKSCERALSKPYYLDASKKRHLSPVLSFIHGEETPERKLCSMTQTSSTVPGAAVRGVASGVLFMAFFGTLWASIGTGGLQGWGGPWLAIVTVLVGIGLLLGGISLLLASRRLPNQAAGAEARRGRRTGIWFGIVFATEGLFIGIASGICNPLHRFDLFFPIMALIVGVHFFPLAALFQVKLHYVAGALLCLLAIITLLVVPESIKLGSQQITAQSVVLGFGAALILWAVGLKLWLLGKKLLALSGLTEA